MPSDRQYCEACHYAAAHGEPVFADCAVCGVPSDNAAELLPCPFCGSAAAYQDPTRAPKSLVDCLNRECVMNRPLSMGREQWNTRAPSAEYQSRERVAKLLRAAKRIVEADENSSPAWNRDSKIAEFAAIIESEFTLDTEGVKDQNAHIDETH